MPSIINPLPPFVYFIILECLAGIINNYNIVSMVSWGFVFLSKADFKINIVQPLNMFSNNKCFIKYLGLD